MCDVITGQSFHACAYLRDGILACRQALQCCDDFVLLPKEIDQTEVEI